MKPAIGDCPDLESIAAYVDGRLSGRARAHMMQHLASCEHCYFVFSEAAQTRPHGGTGAAVSLPWRAWFEYPRAIWSGAAVLATVTAVVIAAQMIPSFRSGREDPIRVALLAFDDALGQTRPIEPRLAGAFIYKPPTPVRRSRTTNPESTLAVREAAIAVERAATAAGPTTEGQRALATLHLYLGRPGRAIEILTPLAEMSTDAALLTDLVAAYLTRRESGDVAHALNLAERAVQVSPDRAEAWFNLGLTAEAVGLGTRAQQAWSRYLQLDPASGWSREATQHLQELKKTGRVQLWRDTRPRLQQMLTTRDREGAARLASTFAEETRTYLERELVPAWAAAHLGGRATAASELIQRAALLATVEADATGDRMPIDIVEGLRHDIDARSPRISDAALGIQELSRGIETYEDVRWIEAMPRFREALKRLSMARQPLVGWAEFYSALDDYYQDRLAQAASKLAALKRHAQSRRYAVLEARCLWMLGLIHSSQARLGASTDEYVSAAASLDRLRQLESLSAVSALAATNFDYLGDLATGWSYRQRALLLSSGLGNRRNRHTILRSAIRAALDQGLDRAALEFENAALENAHEWGAAAAIAEAYLGRASIYADLGHASLARNDLVEARQWLSRIPDALFRQRWEMEVPVIEADVALVDNPRQAVEALTRALGSFEWSGNRKASLYRDRGRAYLAVADIDRAEHDFRSAIQLLDEQRLSLSESLRISFLDRASDVFADMIALQVFKRRSFDTAFEFAERSRARALMDSVIGSGRSTVRTPLDVSRHLPSQTTVLYFNVLDDAVLSWLVTPDRGEFAERRIGANELANLVRLYRQAIEQGRTLEGLRQQSTRLYDLLIAPYEALLPERTALIVVADGPLHDLPFATLFNARTRHFLVQDHAIGLAPSATMFEQMSSQLARRSGEKVSRALVVGNPEPRPQSGQSLPPLPDAQAEARSIATLYHDVELVTGSRATKQKFLSAAAAADVVHFAGHAIANPQHPLLSRLLLTPASADDDGNLFAYEVQNAKFPRTRLVVLAACGTAHGPIRRGEGVVSLARSFLAAGVPAVVASLWDIEDRRSRELFERFYSALQSGESPLDALQHAQLLLLTSDDHSLSTWASFVIVGGNASSTRRR
jgi:CHAT domain-containing protein